MELSFFGTPNVLMASSRFISSCFPLDRFEFGFDTFLDLAVKFCFAPLIEIKEKLVEALDYEGKCTGILNLDNKCDTYIADILTTNVNINIAGILITNVNLYFPLRMSD